MGVIIGGVGFDEKTFPWGFSVEEVFKPVTFGRNVIEDEICHQAISFRDFGNVLPVPKLWIDFQIIDDRKTIIRTVRKEREDVNAVDRLANITIQKGLEGFERSLIGFRDAIAVSDQDAIFFRPVLHFRLGRAQAVKDRFNVRD